MTAPTAAFAALPSPGSNGFPIGPLDLRAYGLMIAFGVLAAVWLAQRRWVARGGDADDIASLALWAVPAGLVGARAYHVATDWRRFENDWVEAFAIWNGGLGIPGGIAVGAVTGVFVARRRGLPIAPLLDTVAPALALAQAVGRWGNWFNQELFGRPTDLPWGLRIDPGNRPLEYLDNSTFHPTFLYESLWNLALVGGLIALDRRHVLPPGRLFATYVGGYAVGRLWIETLRVDEATTILGTRVNIWVMGVLLIGATVAVVVGRYGPRSLDDRTSLNA